LEQLERHAVAPVFAPVPAIFTAIATVLMPVAHILATVAPILEPVEPAAVVTGIAHILAAIAAVLPAIAYIFTTIAAVLTTIPHVFDAIPHVGPRTRHLLRVSGRDDSHEGDDSARIDQSTQHIPSSRVPTRFVRAATPLDAVQGDLLRGIDRDLFGLGPRNALRRKAPQMAA
jgi:hypothetical protein